MLSGLFTLFSSAGTYLDPAIKAPPPSSSLLKKIAHVPEDLMLSIIEENWPANGEPELYMVKQCLDSNANILQSLELNHPTLSENNIWLILGVLHRRLYNLSLSGKEIALKTLALHCCALSPRILSVIDQIIRLNCLTELRLVDMRLNDEGFMALSEAFSSQSQLHYLMLAGNPLSDKGAAGLAQLMVEKKLRSIEGVCLYNTAITSVGADALLHASEQLPYLQIYMDASAINPFSFSEEACAQYGTFSRMPPISNMPSAIAYQASYRQKMERAKIQAQKPLIDFDTTEQGWEITLLGQTIRYGNKIGRL